MRILTASVVAFSMVAVSSAAADDSGKFHQETTVKQGKDGAIDAEVTSEKTDAVGTTTTRKDTAETKTTIGGNHEATSTSKITTDPKGLGNKTADKVEITETQGKDGGSNKEAKHESVDAAGTGHSSKSTTDVEVKRDGTVKTTVKDKSVEDPKGLLNKTTTETTKVTNHKADGTTEISKTQKVDGDTVSEVHKNN